ncbi:hypothetical protein [Pseudomonas sp. FEN]|nr:hypothetical protein [Pseudomonas sp. FEN]
MVFSSHEMDEDFTPGGDFESEPQPLRLMKARWISRLYLDSVSSRAD